jgi:hypothetical protein
MKSEEVDPVLRAVLMLARSVVASLAVAASSIFLAMAAELVFDIKIQHGRVPDDMQLIRVKEGDVVTLRWTTDQAVVLHLHGYDIEKPIVPGAVTELTFTAYATGRFPLHVHAQGERAKSHAHQEAPLIDVEVYPR